MQFRVHHDVQTGVERGGEAMRRKREGGEFHLGFLVWQEEKIVCFMPAMPFFTSNSWKKRAILQSSVFSRH